MTPISSEIDQTLRDDLYQKTRAQLNAFLDETNALLAAGDALNEDRTALARERLADFLNGVEIAEAPVAQEPPLTHVLSVVKDYVKARPLMALGASAAAGLVVSLLLMRNRH